MIVPILTYHAIGEQASPLFVSPAQFESHLVALATAGYQTISLARLAGHLRAGTKLPEKRCVLTFDDGYLSVYREAWPRLKAYGFKATIFLVTDFCGTDNQWPGQPARVPRQRLMGWRHISLMAREGNEFGVHTRSHPLLSLLPLEQAQDEILGAQAVLQERTDQPGRIFAAPYGAIDQRITGLLTEYFDAAVTTRLGIVSATDDPYRLSRIDAYYWKEDWAKQIHTSSLQRKLRLRRLLRTLRRYFRQDWDSSATAISGNAHS